MTKRSTISVIIPCYNGAKYLAETLSSALAQTYPPGEVIVIDDGSTDESAAIAESFGQIVRVIRQTNKGESVARNRGIDTSNSEWVAFLDADDLWESDKLAKQMAAARNDVAAICTGKLFLTMEGGKFVRSTTPVIPVEQDFAPKVIIREGTPCQISSLIVRRTIAARFPTWTRYGEDALYMLDLLQSCHVAIVPEGLSYYRVSAKSQSDRIDIECKWHESFREWINRNSPVLGEASARELHGVLDESLLAKAESAVYRRDWKRLRVIQEFVRGSTGYRLRDQVLRLPKYPLWVYGLRDFTRIRSQSLSRGR